MTAADRPEKPGPRIGVDVGGTFTDVCLAVGDDLVTAKVPTTDDGSVGVLRGIRTACRRAGIDPGDVEGVDHATTVSVNALLERDGARTALVTTAGFRDVLEIGRQDRPALYDLGAEKPEVLVPRERRFEIDERATTDGIERAVEPDDVRAVADGLRDAGAESVAVSLLHAYAHPENEQRVARILREELEVPVSASHEVLPAFREYERTATTVADAYVAPAIEGYLGRLTERAREAGLPKPRVMQATGGIADAETVRERPVLTTMSGPAAGVVGAAATVDWSTAGDGDGGSETAAGDGNGGPDPAAGDGDSGSETAAGDGNGGPDPAAGDGDGGSETAAGDGADSGPGDSSDPESSPGRGTISFDVGGTSTDVSLVRGGDAERTTEATVGGVPIGIPMVDVTTVGAGGGSIARTDAGGALRVGPDSAGATPGPACYDRGGTRPTVTDAALVLGYLGSDATFGGELDLDPDAARRVLAELAADAGLADATAAARGVVRVATARTSRAIRSVTVERGHDPRAFDLVAYGGAGPMLAAAVAADLDVPRVIVPAPAGVCSAYGLLAADESHDALRTVRQSLDAASPESLGAAFEELAESALAASSDPDRAAIELAADCRYAGQRHELTVPVDRDGAGDGPAAVDPDALARRFDAVHERTHGYALDAAVEAVTLRATATVEREEPRPVHDGAGDAVVGEREAVFPETAVTATVYDRGALPPGTTVDGPAILERAESTTVIPPAWSGTVRRDGAVVLERADGEWADGTRADGSDAPATADGGDRR